MRKKISQYHFLLTVLALLVDKMCGLVYYYLKKKLLIYVGRDSEDLLLRIMSSVG